MRHEATLCVFAKPTRPGLVKTRLAAAVGDERAAALARAFLADTWAAASSLHWARAVLATTEPAASEWEGGGLAPVWGQGGGDLGDRLERVLRRALRDTPAALAIGTDTPGLPPTLLSQARSALRDADAVLGPCEDGGFYLLGLRRCPPGLLHDLPWSVAETLARTLSRLRERGLRTAVIAPWFDVDRPADLACLRALIARGELHAPATARALELGAGSEKRMRLAVSSRDPRTPRVSVVIPVLDEEARIGAQLESLARLPYHEVIVVDGGSRDDTVARARATGTGRLLSAPPGRASQMNAGARAATGDVLLFLHADVRLPDDALRHVEEALADPANVAGAFRTWTVADGGASWLAPLLHLADLRARYSGLPYGDQALFVRAEAFRQAGGFPEQPLMEDLELSRRLRRLGRIRTVHSRVTVSGRRFLARPLAYTLAVNLFPALYAAGVSPATLKRFYGDPR